METITNEYYVSPEVAKLLKEAGFDWETRETHRYDSAIVKDYILTHYVTSENWNGLKEDNIDYVSAPTIEVAQRWLREVKKYYVSVVADCDSVGVFYFIRIIYYDTNNNYYATYVWDENNLEHVKHWKIFNNYEEAFEAGIKKALELILKKGK